MENNKKKWYQKWWIWVIVAVFLIIGFAGGGETDNKTSEPKKEEKQTESTTVTFLKSTNSDDFITILESVTGITGTKGVEMGDSITYTNSNEKYALSVDANKETKEIDYARIITHTDEDPTNVFMAFNRMNYSTENDEDLTNWLTSNIGKEATTKIGDANFTLSLSTTNHPILEMKTDGSDDYMLDQIDKMEK